ncbi:MAG: hypothetical protein HY444_08080, partial [Nitrospirae bacterium]|nr:hypothetical protein [Nitrospirota bacterium]
MKAIPTTSRKTQQAKTPRKPKEEKQAAVSVEASPEEGSTQSKLVKQLIATGKEKGFLTLDEINDLIPAGANNPDQLDEVFTVLGEMNIEVIDSNGSMSLHKSAAPADEEETEELDLDPSVDTRTDDPVRMYL